MKLSDGNGNDADGVASEVADAWLNGRVESFGEGVARAEKRRAQQAKRTRAKLSAGKFALTDLGNAERLVERHGHDLRFSRQVGWLAFDGQRWRRDDSGEVVRRAKDSARSIYAELSKATDIDARRALTGHALRSEGAPRIAAAVELASTEAPVVVSASDLDRDHFDLNVRNGTLALDAGVLRPHARADLITKLAPVAYDPAAEAPTWTWFLAQVLPSAAVRDYVQRVIGYCLTADVSEQALWFLYGSGANGKSVFLETLRALLGADYSRQGAPDLLLARRNDAGAGEASAVADLLGVRLLVLSEVEAGRRFAEATVKQLTGGDTIKARRMRADWFEFQPTHKILLAANHKPSVRGTDHAIWRRIRLVPFEVTIAPEQRDPQLGAKLRAELPGILNWALAGFAAWRVGGLAPPPEVDEATADYRGEENTLGSFLADCCALAPTYRVATRDLHAAYSLWCADEGEHPLSAKAFGKQLVDVGRDSGLRPVKGHAGVRSWSGVALTPQAEHRVRRTRESREGGS